MLGHNWLAVPQVPKSTGGTGEVLFFTLQENENKTKTKENTRSHVHGAALELLASCVGVLDIVYTTVLDILADGSLKMHNSQD